MTSSIDMQTTEEDDITSKQQEKKSLKTKTTRLPTPKKIIITKSSEQLNNPIQENNKPQCEPPLSPARRVRHSSIARLVKVVPSETTDLKKVKIEGVKKKKRERLIKE